MKKVIVFLFALTLQTTHAQIIYIDDSGKEGKENVGEHFKNYDSPQVLLQAMHENAVHLKAGLFSERYELNRNYLHRLEPRKLLQNFYAEAGLNKEYMVGKDRRIDDFYWGWESLSGQLRGHFLGHYLSACAYVWAQTGDALLKENADFIVNELARCQKINGGEWVGSIPEKYMYLMADGQPMWSPQYTLHKTLMGLYDMYAVGKNRQALVVLDHFADWFHHWTQEMIEKGKPEAIMNGETSGMLEIWADMYELAKTDSTLNQKKYLDLMERYGNPWLFTQLMKGEDGLSNSHCNASVPWSHGAARCYEVTGNPYWLNVTKAFWRCAIKEREQYCTGGQSAGEHWIPKGKLALFAGENNQEHCTVYNLMRTADYLYRWTGEVEYADYIERNLYNGILAQQHPHTGMVAYFLPMASGYKKGGEKGWGDPTMDFYCCHGSLVQAQNRYLQYIYYQRNDGILISQYIPSSYSCEIKNTTIKVEQDFEANQWTNHWDGNRFKMLMHVDAQNPVRFALQLRLPWWLDKKAQILVDSKPVKVEQLHGYVTIEREWKQNDIVVEFADRIWTELLPGSQNMYAFMEGPIVLAAASEEQSLVGDVKHPDRIFQREMDQQYRTVRWQQSHYRSMNQNRLVRLKPLYEIADESYTIYFPMKK